MISKRKRIIATTFLLLMSGCRGRQNNTESDTSLKILSEKDAQENRASIRDIVTVLSNKTIKKIRDEDIEKNELVFLGVWQAPWFNGLKGSQIREYSLVYGQIKGELGNPNLTGFKSRRVIFSEENDRLNISSEIKDIPDDVYSVQEL